MYSTAVPIQKEKMKLLKQQMAGKTSNASAIAHKKQKHAPQQTADATKQIGENNLLMKQFMESH